MPRSEGIETTFRSLSSTKSKNPERMPRSEGIETSHTATLRGMPVLSRNECPDQRGLRQLELESLGYLGIPGTNALIRGD